MGSKFTQVTAKSCSGMIGRISGTAAPGGVADFSLISRSVHASLRSMRDRHRFVRGMLTWLGFRRTFLEYEVERRRAGTSKYTFRRMVRFALDATFSFSAAPLRLATRIGVGITIGGFIYLGWILVRAHYLKDLVPGWASLIGVTLILGGTQLLFIGLIGEYVARIFEEVKGRPLYTLKQTTRSRFRASTAERAGAVDERGDGAS